MSTYFVGVALPKGKNKIPKDDFGRLLHFTDAQTSGLTIGRGLPIHMDHDFDFPNDSAKIGEVLQSFNFPGGEKGVIGRFDTSNPAGRYFKAKHISQGGSRPALSLGHLQRQFDKKAGEKNVLGNHIFPKDGKEITKKIHHLATCETPAREGCRILLWLGEEEYKEGDPEKYLERLVQGKTPQELEMADTKMTEAAQTKDPKEDEAKAMASLASQKKKDLLEQNLRLQNKLSKAFDDFATKTKEFETLQAQLEEGKKINEENAYLKKLMQESFMSQMEKNFGKFAKLTGLDADAEKQLNENFQKGMIPSSDQPIDTLNRPTFAQNLVDQMVLASEGTINKLREELAEARNENYRTKQTPISKIESSATSEPTLPLKRARVEESSSSSSSSGPASNLLRDLIASQKNC
jgi:hypothetical protein